MDLQIKICTEMKVNKIPLFDKKTKLTLCDPEKVAPDMLPDLRPPAP